VMDATLVGDEKTWIGEAANFSDGTLPVAFT